LTISANWPTGWVVDDDHPNPWHRLSSEHRGAVGAAGRRTRRHAQPDALCDQSLDGKGSGWDAYLRYSALAIKLIKARGGTIAWTGTAEAVALGVAEGNRWDYVALVRYPSRAAFIDMMTSPEYARANVERDNGCAAHTIIAIRETYNRLGSTKE